MGAVVDIQSGYIELADARPGFSQIPEAEAYPDADFEALDRLFLSMFGRDANKIGKALRSLESRLHGGPYKLSQLRKTHGYFSKLQLQFAPDLQFTVDDLLAEPNGFPKVLEAAKVTFVFDPSGTKTDTVHYRGLDQHGPFSRQEFTPNKPRICVVCQRNKKGRVEQLVHKFLDGMQTGAGAQPFKAGLLGKYRLAGAQTEFFLANGPDVSRIERVARRR